MLGKIRSSPCSTTRHLFIFCLLVLEISTVKNEVVQNYCPSGTIFTVHTEGSALKGYVFEKTTALSLVECGLKCVSLQPNCRSFNYIRKPKEQAICEISNSTKRSAKNDEFVRESNSKYVEPNVHVNQICQRPKDQSTAKTGFALSHILAGEDNYIQKLHEWLNNAKNWALCYRATKNDWSFSGFHSGCDNKGPSVTLVRVGSFIFGGYTDVSWGGLAGNKRSTESFLFSFVNNDDLAPFTSPVIQTNSQYAIEQQPHYGPKFGSFYLYINGAGSISDLGTCYQAPSGYYYRQSRTQNLFAGSYTFEPTITEVFYLKK